MIKHITLIAAALFACFSLYAQTPEEDPDIQYGAELLKPGTPAPEFQLNDLEGKAVKLSDFRGKTVVLVFWASWCPDCRKEVPELKEMYSKHGREVQFVSISYDREFQRLKDFAAEKELPGVQLFDPEGMKKSKVGSDYHVKWIPSLYVIGPDGKVKLGTVVASKVAGMLNQ